MKEAISATAPKANDAEFEGEYDFGDDLSDAAEKYGEDVVFGLYKSQAVVRAQAGIRTCLEKGIDPAAWLAQWKPGSKAPSINADPKAAAFAAVSRMSDEEKAELLAKLQATME